MSWADRYLKQAYAWRAEAQKYTASGKLTKAEQCMQNARVYERLAKGESTSDKQGSVVTEHLSKPATRVHPRKRRVLYLRSLPASLKRFKRRLPPPSELVRYLWKG